MAVTVASRGGPRRRRERLAGVRLVRLPAERDSRLIMSAGLLWAGLRLLVSRPGQLLAVCGRCGQERTAAALAVVADAMLGLQPLARTSSTSSGSRPRSGPCRCSRPACVPSCVSVRGSGVNVHPHAGRGDLAAAYPEVFAHAAAVHCVSEAVREEAVRFGLDRAKARVIHPAVDTDYFRPPAVADLESEQPSRRRSRPPQLGKGLRLRAPGGGVACPRRLPGDVRDHRWRARSDRARRATAPGCST